MPWNGLRVEFLAPEEAQTVRCSRCENGLGHTSRKLCLSPMRRVRILATTLCEHKLPVLMTIKGLNLEKPCVPESQSLCSKAPPPPRPPLKYKLQKVSFPLETASPRVKCRDPGIHSDARTHAWLPQAPSTWAEQSFPSRGCSACSQLVGGPDSPHLASEEKF